MNAQTVAVALLVASVAPMVIGALIVWDDRRSVQPNMSVEDVAWFRCLWWLAAAAVLFAAAWTRTLARRHLSPTHPKSKKRSTRPIGLQAGTGQPHREEHYMDTISATGNTRDGLSGKYGRCSACGRENKVVGPIEAQPEDRTCVFPLGARRSPEVTACDMQRGTRPSRKRY